MEENVEKENDFFSNLAFIPSSRAPERKQKALREYIEQLEQRIGATDPARYPRYIRRLNLELELANEELQTVTER